MGESRTSREALIAQMLGELDDLLSRAEQLPQSISQAEARIGITVQILNDAGEKYRLAVTAFTEEAKIALTEHLRCLMSHGRTLALEEQQRIFREAALAASSYDAASRAANGLAGRDRPLDGRWNCVRLRLFEHFLTAVLASVLTAVLVFGVIQLG